MLKKIFFILFISQVFFLQAQDIHFSQVNNSPLNFNPSETGSFKADHRFISNYRNQWASVTVPYKTFSFSYDYRKQNFLKSKNNLGLGMLFNSDVAGDGNFGTIQIKGLLAYHILSLIDSSFNISAGINISYNQESLDFNKLHFGNQYNGSSFDPLMPSNETFYSDQYHFWDFSVGGKINYQLKKTPLIIGFAFHHLNQTKNSFQQIQNSLDSKYNLYIYPIININKDWSAIPSVYYFHQGKYNELFIGSMFEKKLNDLELSILRFGITSRIKDAIIYRIGIRYQDFDIEFSYDMNYSSLTVASRSIGAFEISIIYQLFNNSYFPSKKTTCPVFI
jgi:type IX secretion system PorP/SprF family membrane protein